MRHLITAFIVIAFVLGGPMGPTDAQTTHPTPAQDEFVPVSELPQTEQLPAAPLVIAAYAVFWLFPFAYLWSLRRRMATVDRELADLRERLAGLPRS